MSTQFTVFKNNEVEIQLDERSCKFDLDIIVERPVLEEEGRLFMTAQPAMDEGQVLDVAASLIGPLMYHFHPDRIMAQLEKRLRERGFM